MNEDLIPLLHLYEQHLTVELSSPSFDQLECKEGSIELDSKLFDLGSTLHCTAGLKLHLN